MRVIDLFAGCGGMSLGFGNVGFDIVAAFDNWDAAITIYESNFSHPIYKKDLGADDVIQQISDLHPDIIMGGPPCQDYSTNQKNGRYLPRWISSLYHAGEVSADFDGWLCTGQNGNSFCHNCIWRYPYVGKE